MHRSPSSDWGIQGYLQINKQTKNQKAIAQLP